MPEERLRLTFFSPLQSCLAGLIVRGYTRLYEGRTLSDRKRPAKLYNTELTGPRHRSRSDQSLSLSALTNSRSPFKNPSLSVCVSVVELVIVLIIAGSVYDLRQSSPYSVEPSFPILCSQSLSPLTCSRTCLKLRSILVSEGSGYEDRVRNVEEGILEAVDGLDCVRVRCFLLCPDGCSRKPSSEVSPALGKDTEQGSRNIGCVKLPGSMVILNDRGCICMIVAYLAECSPAYARHYGPSSSGKA